MNTVTLYGDPDAARLLRDLKGAPLSCLIALYIEHPHPVGQRALQMLTAFSKDAVSKAMNVLVNLHHLASRVGRYESWCLTTKGIQLRLPLFLALSENVSPRAPGEGEKNALEMVVGSGLYLSSSNDLVQTTTTTTEREGVFSAFPNASARIMPNENGLRADALPQNVKPAIDILPSEANALIEKYLRGCKRATSQHAVRAALARGESLADIEAEMIAWVMYAESPLGKGIRSPAIHAVSKIKDGEKCPDFLFRVNEKDREHGDAWRKWLEANESWLARLSALQTPASDTPAPDAAETEIEPPDEARPEMLHSPARGVAPVLIKNMGDEIAARHWATAQLELQLQMTKATFDTWVKPTFALAYDAARAELVIGVRNPYAKQWLENRLYGMIERTIQHVLGGIPTKIKFTQVNAT